MQWNAIYLGSLQLWQIPETAEFALVPVLAQDLIMVQAHQLVLDLGVVETLAPALAAVAVAAEAVTAVAAAGLALSLRSALPVG